MNTLQSSALPIDAAERKAAPVFSGVLMYFPRTMVALARVSLAGNIQHYGPGTPLHWNREVSRDHKDCAVRHLMQAGTLDGDGSLHDVKAAWRALANAEEALEALEAQIPEREQQSVREQIEAALFPSGIVALVPPYASRDADDDLGLTAGEAISAGGTD